MGSFPQTGPSKIQTFNLLSWTYEIFKVSKYKRNIKFDKIREYQNWLISLKWGPPKFKLFNHTC